MGDQVSPLTVEAGLYVLRYVKPLSRGASPTVEVRIPAEFGRYVQAISSPFDDPGVIGGPGGCLVLRAERPATLQIVVRTPAGHGEVELQLEPLVTARTAAARPAAGQPQQPGPAQAGLPQAGAALDILAHVSRRGDVKVGAEAWIAGPASPAPIEGLEIRTGGLPGLRLEYQVLVGGAGGGWTRWMSGGEYAGTRGQARPLLGIRLRLSGGAGQGVTLGAEALFLGASVESARGDVVELVSGAGIDPLVGLKLTFVPARSEAGRLQGGPVPSGSAQPAGPRTGRVRVFRASGVR
ncbi:hypothetical protein [Methylobacterium sp. ID0610]|uniref:hypothetical protein n=1 Tax=Methylobacterium carpenticola TaxID=3344827 RepID=UPI0036C47AE5